MTFEAFIKELNNALWRLGSLCQLSGTEWHACLIDDEGYAHTATGDGPIDAMATALHRPRTGRLFSAADGVYLDNAGDKIDLQALGLTKPRPQLKRRPL